MRYAIPLLLGLLLGFLMFFFLPLILTAYLADLWQTTRGTPHVCDAGADLSPTAEAAEAQIKAETKLWRKLREIEDLMSDRSTDA
jgi:hypothetical protein